MIHGYTTRFFVAGLYRQRFPTAPALSDTNISATSRTGTTVTGSATPHTMGAWTTLLASLSQTLTILSLGVRNNLSGSAQNNVLLELGVGAAGAEAVVIPRFDCGFSNPGTEYRWFSFPGLSIAASSRLAARLQSNSASNPNEIIVFASGALVSPPAASAYVTYGADSATSSGVNVPAGVNSFGAWTQIGTTSAAHSIFTVGCGPNTARNMATGDRLIEIAYGPDTSSLTLIGNTRQCYISGRGLHTANPLCLYRSVPTSSKLWARIAAASTANSGITISAI